MTALRRGRPKGRSVPESWQHFPHICDDKLKLKPKPELHDARSEPGWNDVAGRYALNGANNPEGWRPKGCTGKAKLCRICEVEDFPIEPNVVSLFESMRLRDREVQVPLVGPNQPWWRYPQGTDLAEGRGSNRRGIEPLQKGLRSLQRSNLVESGSRAAETIERIRRAGKTEGEAGVPGPYATYRPPT